MKPFENPKTWLAAFILTLIITALSIVGAVIFSLKIIYPPLVASVLFACVGMVFLPICYNKLKSFKKTK